LLLGSQEKRVRLKGKNPIKSNITLKAVVERSRYAAEKTKLEKNQK